MNHDEWAALAVALDRRVATERMNSTLASQILSTLQSIDRKLDSLGALDGPPRSTYRYEEPWR